MCREGEERSILRVWGCFYGVLRIKVSAMNLMKDLKSQEPFRFDAFEIRAKFDQALPQRGSHDKCAS